MCAALTGSAHVLFHKVNLMQDFSALFAAEFAQQPALQPPALPLGPAGIRKYAARAARGAPDGSVLQLNATPFAINPADYANPQSADNPTGSYRSAYRLTQLADPVPGAGTYYLPGLQSTAKVWNNIANLARTESEATLMLLGEAQETMKSARLSGMGGIPDDWYPVYANPGHWYELVKDPAHLVRMEIDVDEDESDATLTPGPAGISLQTLRWDEGRSSAGLSAASKIKKVTVDVLRVDFVRPWLNFELMTAGDWKISGRRPGYYSNGQRHANDGILPLIAKSMLVGAKVSLEGHFEREDLRRMSGIVASDQALSIGPFLVDTVGSEHAAADRQPATLSADIIQVIGFISQLVPVAPAL